MQVSWVCEHIKQEIWCLVTVVCYPYTLVQWAIPVLMYMFGFFLQNVQLNIGTFLYVQKMMSAPSTCSGILYDSFHEAVGYAHVDMKMLDKITLLPVFFWMVGTLYLRDLRLWSKVFCCAAIMHVWKGVFTWVTVVNDSSGWDNCKDRLGDTIKWHESLIGKPWGEVLGSSMALVFTGFGGVWPVRFCADMIPSGHTFTAFLFSLGMMDMTRRLWFLVPKCTGAAIMGIAWSIAGVLFFAEFYFVILNHFHYAVDMMLAVLLVLLFYTNAGIALFVDWYVELFKKKEDRTNSAGMIWIPFFFVPFCFFGASHYMLKETSHDEVKEKIIAGNPRLQDISEVFEKQPDQKPLVHSVGA